MRPRQARPRRAEMAELAPGVRISGAAFVLSLPLEHAPERLPPYGDPSTLAARAIRGARHHADQRAPGRGGALNNARPDRAMPPSSGALPTLLWQAGMQRPSGAIRSARRDTRIAAPGARCIGSRTWRRRCIARWMRKGRFAGLQPIHLGRLDAADAHHVPRIPNGQVAHRLPVDEVVSADLNDDVADASGPTGAVAAHQRIGQILSARALRV